MRKSPWPRVGGAPIQSRGIAPSPLCSIARLDRLFGSGCAHLGFHYPAYANGNHTALVPATRVGAWRSQPKIASPDKNAGKPKANHIRRVVVARCPKADWRRQPRQPGLGCAFTPDGFNERQLFCTCNVELNAVGAAAPTKNPIVRVLNTFPSTISGGARDEMERGRT